MKKLSDDFLNFVTEIVDEYTHWVRLQNITPNSVLHIRGVSNMTYLSSAHLAHIKNFFNNNNDQNEFHNKIINGILLFNKIRGENNFYENHIKDVTCLEYMDKKNQQVLRKCMEYSRATNLNDLFYENMDTETDLYIFILQLRFYLLFPKIYHTWIIYTNQNDLRSIPEFENTPEFKHILSLNNIRADIDAFDEILGLPEFNFSKDDDIQKYNKLFFVDDTNRICRYDNKIKVKKLFCLLEELYNKYQKTV